MTQNLKRVSKYRNRTTYVNGLRFASKREAERYQQLALLQSQGKISDLRLQPKFCLLEGFTRAGKRYRPITYVADFAYWLNGEQVIEDVKGYQTPEFKIKQKLFLTKFSLELRLIF